MPDYDIDTGFEAEDAEFRRGVGARPQREALFHSLSPLGETLSRRVSVRPGKVFLFQAFALPPDRRIFVNIVSFGVLDGRRGADLYIQRMTLGGAESWELTFEKPQMLITLPGVYRFELESADMLGGDMRLEYFSWDVPQPPVFPVFR